MQTVLNFSIAPYVTNVEVPWALAFANDGRLFFTERAGRVRVVENDVLNPTPVTTLRDVYVEGEAGLMGLALHPNFATNGYAYICYTTKNINVEVNVKKLRIVGSSVVDENMIIDHIPGANFHIGCALKFGPDKKLYITTGDATKSDSGQDLTSLAGKTLRLNDDGTIPHDNPFQNNAQARKEIWSFGHRNAQGMDFQPDSGLMFQTEHGPSGFDGGFGGDEINIVESSSNYGWPIIHHRKIKPGMVSPLLEYTPAIAPAGACFYRNKNHPNYYGNFFVASLKGERIIRVIINQRQVISQENWMKGDYGRIRDITEGPDGALYFSTSNRDGRGNTRGNDDKIIRIKFN